MSDALSRFKHIQSLRGKIHDEGSENNPILQEVVRDTEIVSKWRESPDYEFSDYLLSEKKTEEEAQRLRAMSVSVSFEEVDALLNDLKNKWSENNRNAFLKQCQKESLYQIAAAFGMGKVIAAYDKEGGNVTTTHNARKDIYARDEDKFRREEYTGYDYTKASKNYRDSKISIDFTVQDEYTGKILYYKNQKNRSSVDADHIYPVKKYHQEGGFIQNKEQRNSFGSDPDNFAVTNYSINSSLQDLDKKNWMKKKRKDGSKKNNKEFYEINESFIDTAVQRGQCATKKHAPTNKDWAAYYTERTVATGIKESGKMGIQQASGALFIEFFSAIYAEFYDAFKNGFIDGVNAQGIIEATRKRFVRILKRVASQWKELVKAFRDGAISGFLSNILTTIINIFIKTAKNIVRIIREAFFSLFKAIKLLIMRPKGMSLAEAADAAVKILITGVSVILTVQLEDKIQIMVAMVPFLAPIASGVARALTGVLATLVSALMVCLWDKIDLFGANAKARHKFVIEKLNNQIREKDMHIQEMDKNIKSIDREVDEIYTDAMYPFGKPLLQ